MLNLSIHFSAERTLNWTSRFTYVLHMRVVPISNLDHETFFPESFFL